MAVTVASALRATGPRYEVEILAALREALERFPPRPRQVLVVGCSTSEILGLRIGSASNLEVAAAVYRALEEESARWAMNLAFQCCEHLNRAVLVEGELLERLQLSEVAAIPVIGAGGALAVHAYGQMENPRLAESIRADYGIDIGSTMIGMHLKPVAVPVRVAQRTVGEAAILIARTRAPLIGGNRAQYPEDKGK
jgi:uncharacterized protein (TIGR01440 family)